MLEPVSEEQQQPRRRFQPPSGSERAVIAAGQRMNALIAAREAHESIRQRVEATEVELANARQRVEIAEAAYNDVATQVRPTTIEPSSPGILAPQSPDPTSKFGRAAAFLGQKYHQARPHAEVARQRIQEGYRKAAPKVADAGKQLSAKYAQAAAMLAAQQKAKHVAKRRALALKRDTEKQAEQKRVRRTLRRWERESAKKSASGAPKMKVINRR